MFSYHIYNYVRSFAGLLIRGDGRKKRRSSTLNLDRKCSKCCVQPDHLHKEGLRLSMLFEWECGSAPE